MIIKKYTTEQSCKGCIYQSGPECNYPLARKYDPCNDCIFVKEETKKKSKK